MTDPLEDRLDWAYLLISEYDIEELRRVTDLIEAEEGCSCTPNCSVVVRYQHDPDCEVRS